MKLRMLHIAVGAMLVAVALSFAPSPIHAQQTSAVRKLIIHPPPLYPPLARNMALAGVVKLDALVTPDGSVKSVSVLGGHPVLAQAAVNTLRHWKWEPAGRETHEVVQIVFSRPE